MSGPPPQGPPPSSTTRSWRQRVLEADPDFVRKSLKWVLDNWVLKQAAPETKQ